MARPVEQPSQNGDARRSSPERQALDVVLRCFLDAVGAETGMVLSRTEDGTTSLLCAAGQAERRAVTPWISGTFLDGAFAAKSALVEHAPEPPGAEGREPAARAVTAPILTAGETLGVIYAGFATASSLGERELRWAADSYGRLAALCMAGNPGLTAAVGSSSFDALTGCLDYAGLLRVLRAEIERSQRHHHALSCCFLDLDGFKRVNDDHGHLEGNRALAAAAAGLRAGARGHDTVARFGGDEFVIMLPETDGRAARGIAQRHRAAIRSSTADLSSVPIEASIGIAQWDAQMSASDLLDAADDALRAAKRNGGARVAVGAIQAGVRTDGILGLAKELVRGRNGAHPGPG